MKWGEVFDFLDAVGVIEGKIDGIFVGILFPLDHIDGSQGFKLSFDNTNITEISFRAILDEAVSRGKKKTTIIRADREMTVIYTPKRP